MKAKGKEFTPPSGKPDLSEAAKNLVRTQSQRAREAAEKRKLLAQLKMAASLNALLIKRLANGEETSIDGIYNEYRSAYNALYDALLKSGVKEELLDSGIIRKTLSDLSLSLLSDPHVENSEKDRGIQAKSLVRFAALIGKDFSDEYAYGEFVRDEAIDMLQTHLSNESKLASALAEFDAKHIKNVQDESKREAVKNLIYGKVGKKMGTSERTKHLFNAIIVPVALEMQRALNQTVGKGEENLSKQDLRIQKKFFMGFVTKEVRDILRYEAIGFASDIAQARDRQEEWLVDALFGYGALDYWIKDKLTERMKRYPALTDHDHSVSEMLEKAVKNINAKNDGNEMKGKEATHEAQ